MASSVHLSPARRQLNAVSLARALSKLGVTSRSQARGWIEAGRVLVDGRVVRDPDRRIDLDAVKLVVDGKPVAASSRVYLALHKPKGVVTTRSDEQGRETVYGVLARAETADTRWVAPVGRLDRDSSGLLLLTNDTQWGAGISDPGSAVTKTYHVRVQPRITPEHLSRLSAPVSLVEDFGPPVAVSVVRESPRGTWLEVTLTEGKNREIRRMCARLGYRVETLVRIRIGSIALGDLKPGEIRRLTSKEVAALRVRSR
ncbi:MAG TPA: pseudouridine synthase [Nitrospiria bacterium]|nr:pseudouridine synthase [Nitrospiria bacterium]